MRQGMTNSSRFIAALVAVGALAATATLNGCGGGTGTGGTLITGLRIQGTVVDDAGRGVSGIQITVLDDRGTTLGRALSGTNGLFIVELPTNANPRRFRVDLASRADEYYVIVQYGARSVQGCAFDLPPLVLNRAEIGQVRVFRSEGAPPPPPTDICD